MQLRQALIGWKAPPLLVAGFAVVALLAAPASPAEPVVMKVNWRFAVVRGYQPPDIAETRIIGAGELAFRGDDLFEGKFITADSAKGRIFVEYDRLVDDPDVSLPEQQTFRVAIKVVEGEYKDSGEESSVHLTVEVVGSTDGSGHAIPRCKPGKTGFVELGEYDGKDGYTVSVPGCGIWSFLATARAPKSRVQVTITPACLRTTAARKPLCGGLKLESGTYRADQMAGGNHYPGTWNLTVSGSHITGTSMWPCCPGSRKDPLAGTVNGTTVVIVRDCTGQGYAGACRQKFTGRLVSTGRVEGKWTDTTGSIGSGTFTLVRK